MLRHIQSEIQYSIVTHQQMNDIVESYSSKIYALLSRCLLTLVPVTLGDTPFLTTLLCPEFSRFGSGLVTGRVCCRAIRLLHSKVAYWTLFEHYDSMLTLRCQIVAVRVFLSSVFFQSLQMGNLRLQDVKFQLSSHNVLFLA